jgi:hypothetical protein
MVGDCQIAALDPHVDLLALTAIVKRAIALKAVGIAIDPRRS